MACNCDAIVTALADATGSIDAAITALNNNYGDIIARLSAIESSLGNKPDKTDFSILGEIRDGIIRIPDKIKFPDLGSIHSKLDSIFGFLNGIDWNSLLGIGAAVGLLNTNVGRLGAMNGDILAKLAGWAAKDARTAAALENVKSAVDGVWLDTKGVKVTAERTLSKAGDAVGKIEEVGGNVAGMGGKLASIASGVLSIIGSIASIGAFIAGLVNIFQNEQIKQMIANLDRSIRQQIDLSTQIINNTVKWDGDKTRSGQGVILDGVRENGRAIATNNLQIIQSSRETRAAIEQSTGVILDGVRETRAAIEQQIKGAMSRLSDQLAGIAPAVIAEIKKAIDAIGLSLGQSIGKLKDDIGGSITAGVGEIKGKIDGVGSALGKKIDGLSLTAIVPQINSHVTTTVTTSTAAINSNTNTGINTLVNTLGTGINTVRTSTQQLTENGSLASSLARLDQNGNLITALSQQAQQQLAGIDQRAKELQQTTQQILDSNGSLKKTIDTGGLGAGTGAVQTQQNQQILSKLDGLGATLAPAINSSVADAVKQNLGSVLQDAQAKIIEQSKAVSDQQGLKLAEIAALGLTAVAGIGGISGAIGGMGNLMNKCCGAINQGLDGSNALLGKIYAQTVANGAGIATNNTIATTGAAAATVSAANTVNILGKWNWFTNAWNVFTEGWDKFAKWSHVDRILNVYSFALNLHNAYMLSSNLTVTLGGILDQINDLLGSPLKDKDGNPLSVTTWLGSTITSFIEAIIGKETLADWKNKMDSASRIYGAASNIVQTTIALGDSLSSLLEVVGSYTGKIGNALKSAGAVWHNAYEWMSQDLTAHVQTGAKWERIFRVAEHAQDTLSTIETVTGEAVTIRDNLNSLRDQRAEFYDSLHQNKQAWDGTSGTIQFNGQEIPASYEDNAKASKELENEKVFGATTADSLTDEEENPNG